MEANRQPIGDEIDLLELWKVLWGRKQVFICTVAGFALASVLYSLQLTDIFRAEALLSPSALEGSTQLSGNLGFAANFSGLSFGQSSNVTANALATLRSREFVMEFISDHDLLPWLFASEYSASEGISIIDSDLYNVETLTWARLFEENSSIPADGKAYKRFMNILKVEENRDTGHVTIAIEWPDPTLASEWVNSLVNDINGYIKAKDKREAQLAIEYLQGQLNSTQLVEMQRVFYQLIESQTRTLMLADIREGYVFETIDPAVVPEEKSKPRRFLICMAGTLLGGLLAVLYVLMSHYMISGEKNLGPEL